MIFNFKEITGLKDSKQENFEELCSRLIINSYPDGKPVEGKGGDEGVDSFVGIFNGECRVYQCKYFIEKIGSAQRRQIEKSLKRAISSHKLKSWTLMVPKNLTPSEIKWFQALQKKNGSLKMDWWGETKLQDQISKFSSLIRDFQPRQSTTNIFLNGKIDINNSDREEILRVIQQALNLNTNDQTLNSALTSTAESILSASKLNIVIWGPGIGGGELYKKRCQVKENLISLGHKAFFPEDQINEGVSKSGLNLTVDELISALDVDYIVCLMGSPGSIGEVHDFGKKKKIASKMMICIDQLHSQGYSATGLIPIFQGHNGQVIWFESPKDLKECHLATKILSQINNVYQAKQWELAVER